VRRISALGALLLNFPVASSCIKCNSVSIEHKYEAKMALRHLETQIMDQTRSADYRTITAKTNTRFEFFNNGEWVPAVHITETSFQVRRKAPQRRVVQRIETAAWEGV
jgi:hypothetical protein